MVLSIGFGYQSLNYISYPTKLLFKSSKILAIMISGYLIFNSKYSLSDIVSGCFIFFGLLNLYTSTGFSHKKESNENIYGLLLIIFSLFFDSISQNLLEKYIKDDESNIEVIFYINSLGSIYLIIICYFFDQLFTPFHYCFIEKPQIFLLIFTFSFFGYIGFILIKY
jgi:adenosine 3'-phospho 5'-phosphosulfate transporter B3